MTARRVAGHRDLFSRVGTQLLGAEPVELWRRARGRSRPALAFVLVRALPLRHELCAAALGIAGVVDDVQRVPFERIALEAHPSHRMEGGDADQFGGPAPHRTRHVERENDCSSTPSSFRTRAAAASLLLVCERSLKRTCRSVSSPGFCGGQETLHDPVSVSARGSFTVRPCRHSSPVRRKFPLEVPTRDGVPAVTSAGVDKCLPSDSADRRDSQRTLSSEFTHAHV